MRVFTTRRAQQRGRRAEDGDAFLPQPGHQVRAGAHGVVVHQHQRGAGCPGQPGLFDGRVVGGRRALRDTVRRPERKGLQIGRHKVGDAAVLDHHALGQAGAARGVDQIRQAVRMQPGRGLGRVRGVQGRRRAWACRVDHVRQRCRPALQALGAAVVGQQGHGRGVLQDELDTGIRKRRVQAGVGRAGLQHSQLCDEELLAGARQQDGDHAFAVHKGAQVLRQGIRAKRQLGIGQ